MVISLCLEPLHSSCPYTSSYRKLIPNIVPKKPWSHITADFITKLLLAQGHDSILVVCDRIMKIVYFVSTTEKTLVEEVVRLFWDNI